MKQLDTFSDLAEYYNSLSFEEKYSLATLCRKALLESIASSIKTNGCLFADSSLAISCNDGDNYVYVWMHLVTGDIFYVGRGVGVRWKNHHRSKNSEFEKHLESGDAVVYKIIDGVDTETARFYERYLSLSLSGFGAKLANKDNNVFVCGRSQADKWMEENKDRISNEFTAKVNDVVLNITNKVDIFKGFDAKKALALCVSYRNKMIQNSENYL